MLKLNPAQSAQNNYEVIDQFFAAQVACNESEETLKALFPYRFRMSRYISLDFFREHFRVVDPEVLMKEEPNKHYDPFIEREDTVLSVDE
jgi:hypothetical protein